MQLKAVCVCVCFFFFLLWLVIKVSFGGAHPSESEDGHEVNEGAALASHQRVLVWCWP